jgi:hypothetical protein
MLPPAGLVCDGRRGKEGTSRPDPRPLRATPLGGGEDFSLTVTARGSDVG